MILFSWLWVQQDYSLSCSAFYYWGHGRLNLTAYQRPNKQGVLFWARCHTDLVTKLPDGTCPSGAVQCWSEQHPDTLRNTPKLEISFSDKKPVLPSSFQEHFCSSLVQACVTVVSRLQATTSSAQVPISSPGPCCFWEAVWSRATTWPGTELQCTGGSISASCKSAMYQKAQDSDVYWRRQHCSCTQQKNCYAFKKAIIPSTYVTINSLHKCCTWLLSAKPICTFAGWCSKTESENPSGKWWQSLAWQCSICQGMEDASMIYPY